LNEPADGRILIASPARKETRMCRIRRAVAIALVAALGAPTGASAAILYYTTNEGSAFVETNQNGRLDAAGCLVGCPALDLHLGVASMTTGSATARLSPFVALAEASGGPSAYARAGASGVLEFRVGGTDATWSAVATGRLGGSASLSDLTGGSSWRVDYNTWPPPSVSLVDGHLYRMTLGAGGNSIGAFYPGGSARITFGNVEFVAAPEPATLALALVGLAGVVLARRRQCRT
jgi:hypothetical protein